MSSNNIKPLDNLDFICFLKIEPSIKNILLSFSIADYLSFMRKKNNFSIESKD